MNTVTPVRYPDGRASHRRRAVAADRSPTTLAGTRRGPRRGPPRPTGCRPLGRRARPGRPFWGRSGVVWGGLPVPGVDEPRDHRPGSVGDPGDGPDADPLAREATDQGRVGLPDRTLSWGRPRTAGRRPGRGASGCPRRWPHSGHVGRRTPGAWRGGGRVRGRFAHPGRIERCHRSSHYQEHRTPPAKLSSRGATPALAASRRTQGYRTTSTVIPCRTCSM